MIVSRKDSSFKPLCIEFETKLEVENLLDTLRVSLALLDEKYCILKKGENLFTAKDLQLAKIRLDNILHVVKLSLKEDEN